MSPSFKKAFKARGDCPMDAYKYIFTEGDAPTPGAKTPAKPPVRTEALLRDEGVAFAQAATIADRGPTSPTSPTPVQDPLARNPVASPVATPVLQRAESPRGEDPFANEQLGIMWIDYNPQAYLGNKLLNGDPLVTLKGFCDNPESPQHADEDDWFNYVVDRAEHIRARVAVVICNKKHMRLFQELNEHCIRMRVKAPRFVIVTRDREFNTKEITDMGFEPPAVTHDWEIAADTALRYVQRQIRCRYGAECRHAMRGTCRFLHKPEEMGPRPPQ